MTTELHEPGAPYRLVRDEIDDTETVASPRQADESFGPFVRRSFAERRWAWPVAIFLVAATVFGLFSWERITGPSPDPHFAYLATTMNSMVAAALGDEEAQQRREGLYPFELERRPPHQNDWASWWDITTRDGQQFKGIWLDDRGQGRFKTLDGQVYYLERSQIDYRKRTERFFVSFPPGPAFLMMPLAAIWDYEVNDVLLTVLFAALNVALMYLLLRRMALGGRTARSRSDNLWLTALFGFGTVHLWCAVLGQVWFSALIMGVTFTLLYIHFAIDAKYPFLAGLALALGFATRTPLLFTSVFFFAFVLFPGGQLLRRDQWGWAAKKLAWFCAPCLAVGLGLLWMNYLRFGSPTEFGHTYLAGGSLGRIQTYGLFNYQFLSKNLTAAFTLLPRFQPTEPYVVISKHGMSLLLTTPAFIYLLWPKKRESRRDRYWFRLLWLTVAVTAIPGLLYQNTGYEQFGFRFSLDYTPYLVLLLAVGRHPITWVFKLLTVVGIGVNAFGAVTFKRFGQFYSDDFFV